MALHQHVDGKNRTSRYIFLHPPDLVKTALEKLFPSTSINGNDGDSSGRDRKNTVLMHILVCFITETGWRPFISDLERELERLVRSMILISCS
jgi:hypothetical protein